MALEISNLNNPVICSDYERYLYDNVFDLTRNANKCPADFGASKAIYIPHFNLNNTGEFIQTDTGYNGEDVIKSMLSPLVKKYWGVEALTKTWRVILLKKGTIAIKKFNDITYPANAEIQDVRYFNKKVVDLPDYYETDVNFDNYDGYVNLSFMDGLELMIRPQYSGGAWIIDK